MHHPYPITSNLTDILTAFGTVGAVVTSVYFFYKEKIKNYRTRPKLKIDIHFYPPECHSTRVHSAGFNVPAHWFRLFVKNEGKSNAKDLEVLIEAVEIKTGDKWQTYPEFLPSNLVWTHINSPYLSNLLPGTMKNVDLGYILDPKKRISNTLEYNNLFPNGPTDIMFNVNISVKPYNQYNIIGPGEYKFSLIVGASNCDPIREKFNITFSNEWQEDINQMLDKTIMISKIK